MTRYTEKRLGIALALSWVALPLVAQAQTTPNGPAEPRPATASSSVRDAKAELKVEVKAGDKKPQVRTYSSVTVVSDPTQVPRLPLPNRSAAEPRENVRALREEIQEMRRSLRKERAGGDESPSPASARPDVPPGAGRGAAAPAASGNRPAAESEPRAATQAEARDPSSREPGPREPREPASPRRERENRERDTARQRAWGDSDRGRAAGDSDRLRSAP